MNETITLETLTEAIDYMARLKKRAEFISPKDSASGTWRFIGQQGLTDQVAVGEGDTAPEALVAACFEACRQGNLDLTSGESD